MLMQEIVRLPSTRQQANGYDGPKMKVDKPERSREALPQLLIAGAP